MVKQADLAALLKFSDTSSLSQSEEADYAQPLALPHLEFFLWSPFIHIKIEVWTDPEELAPRESDVIESNILT